jgi:tripartite-type tricarboxylate transporter receptor subunit TctC
LGQAVIIDNKAGAATVIGVDAVAKSPPDGYTLLVSGASSFTIVPALRDKLPFDVTKDLLPIALVAYAPLVVVTSVGKSYQRLADVLAHAKAKPKALLYSTYVPVAASPCGRVVGRRGRSGSSSRALQGQRRRAARIDSGDVDIGVETVSAASAQIKAGKLRALAVTSAQRSPSCLRFLHEGTERGQGQHSRFLCNRSFRQGRWRPSLIDWSKSRRDHVNT